MKFEDSPLSKIFRFLKVEMPFGDFYLCENFIISELHEGIHFDLPKIKMASKEILDYYDKDIKLSYISNRVNSYSIDPQGWSTINITLEQLIKNTAIVYSNHMTELNTHLEKHFSKLEMHTCYTLEEAINWVNTYKKVI